MIYLKKLWNKIRNLFKQGLSPHQLALSITIATVVSIFPAFGLATLVITSLALPLKLNLPIMIFVSYVVEPLKILLVIPFINIGAFLFGAEHTLLSFEAIKASYALDFWMTIKDLSYELVCGAAGWALTALPLSVLLYFLLKKIIHTIVKLKNYRAYHQNH